MDALSRQSEVFSHEIAHRAHHALKAANEDVGLAVLRKLREGPGHVGLDVAASAAPIGGTLGKREGYTEPRVDRGKGLEKSLLELGYLRPPIDSAAGDLVCISLEKN